MKGLATKQNNNTPVLVKYFREKWESISSWCKQYLSQSHSIRTIAILAVVNAGIYLAYQGLLSQWLRWFVASRAVDKANLEYINNAQHYTTELLAVTSESKMLLSVLQSSQGGVDFFIDVEIQLGKILTPLVDLVDYAWDLALAALASIEILRFLLQIGELSMTPLLTAFLMLIGLTYVTRSYFVRISSLFCSTAKIVGIAVLLTHFLIPWSIYSTAQLSDHVLAPHKTAIYQGYSDLHSDLPQHSDTQGLKQQVKGGILHFKHQQKKLHKHTSVLTSLTAKHLVISLLEYLMLPLVFLALFALTLRYWIKNIKLSSSPQQNAST